MSRILSLMPNEPSSRRSFCSLLVVGVLFLGLVLWSMWTETLEPLVRAGDPRALALHAVGLPLILIGLGVFVWGGWRFLVAHFRAWSAPEMRGQLALVEREGDDEWKRLARRESMRMLLRAWSRPAVIMFFGFSLLALGGYLINA